MPQTLQIAYQGAKIDCVIGAGTLEKARQMAAHALTRTTQLYDWSEDRVTLDEVVKINIRGEATLTTEVPE